MKFGSLTNEILDLALGEAYAEGKGYYHWTLRSELEDVGEDILQVEYTINPVKPIKILTFQAWTENYILVLVPGLFEDQSILKVPKQPPTPKEV